MGRRALGLCLLLLVALLGATKGTGHAQYEGVVDRARPAVVLITVEFEGASGHGTGFFIDPAGYLVTARHVIEGASRITILVADGRRLPVVVVRYSSIFDGAILKAEGSDFQTLSLGDSDTVRQGQEILALGYPRPDYLSAESMTVTRGIISAVRPSEGLIQVDAPLNPGNSGGPVLNLRGEVIGVVARRVPGAQGLNLAVASNLIRTITAQLSPTPIPPPQAQPRAPVVAQPREPLTGTWDGTWRSWIGLGGQLRASLRQEGTTVRGNTRMTNSSYPFLDASGRFQNGELTLDVFQGTARTGTFTGRLVNPDVLEGRYNSPAVFDWGTWRVNRTGE